MALNFPSSPTVGQVYYDTTSGFYYEWDGTVWKSYSPSSTSQIKVLDDISSSFDDVTTTFALTSSSVALTPVNAQSLIINLGGVIQDSTSDYTVSGSNIEFTTAPQSGLTFSGVSLGPAINLTLTDIVSTNDTTTNSDFYPVFVDGTSATSPTVSTSKLTFNPSTGILSVDKSVVGSATTFTEDLVVQGDARVTGILTVGTASITLDGSTNKITVGSGVTIDGSTGIISATSLSLGGQTVSTLGVGIATEGGTVGTGATVLDFRGAGISTVTVAAGIATINITGGSGGGGASVSISTIAPTSPNDGDLWFDNSDGNTYIWYDSQSVWVVSQTYGY